MGIFVFHPLQSSFGHFLASVSSSAMTSTFSAHCRQLHWRWTERKRVGVGLMMLALTTSGHTRQGSFGAFPSFRRPPRALEHPHKDLPRLGVLLHHSCGAPGVSRDQLHHRCGGQCCSTGILLPWQVTPSSHVCRIGSLRCSLRACELAVEQMKRWCRDGGSWASTYGQFFLEWYSQQLLQHADSLLEVAADVFAHCPVEMHASIPSIHWWHHTKSHAVRLPPLDCLTSLTLRHAGHLFASSSRLLIVSVLLVMLSPAWNAVCLNVSVFFIVLSPAWNGCAACIGAARCRTRSLALDGQCHYQQHRHRMANFLKLQAELTAGINHSSMHEGYLPIIQALSRHCCHVLMSGCEQLTDEQPNAAACDPEQLISHVRTCASVEAVKVSSCHIASVQAGSSTDRIVSPTSWAPQLLRRRVVCLHAPFFGKQGISVQGLYFLLPIWIRYICSQLAMPSCICWFEV
jgi:hypothetical protein